MTRLILLTLAIVAASAAQAQPPSVAGNWTVRQDISGNQSEQTCTFTQKEAEFTGTCAGERGSVMVTGKVDAKAINWQYDTQYEGQTLTIYYTGTPQSAEKITGTVNVQPMNVSGEFTATKTKQP